MLFALTVFQIFISCTEANNGTNDVNANMEGIINKEGIYSSYTKKYELIVKIDSDCIVNYSVTGNDTKTVLFRDKAGSKYQQWYMIWDTNDKLWVHSSDTGSSIWFKNQEGKWKNKEIDKDMVNQMPENFKKNLPDTLKKIWYINK